MCVLGWPVSEASTHHQQMGTHSFLWVMAQRWLCWAPGDKGDPVQRNTRSAALTDGRPHLQWGAAGPRSKFKEVFCPKSHTSFHPGPVLHGGPERQRREDTARTSENVTLNNVL